MKLVEVKTVLKETGVAKITMKGTSMEPLIHDGDEFIVKKFQEKFVLKKFDIILFYIDQSLVCHYIREIHRVDNQVYYVPKGLNNKFLDPKIMAKDIIGIVPLKIPFSRKILFNMVDFFVLKYRKIKDLL